MARFHVSVDWRLEGDFLAKRYSRAHEISFEGALVVPGSPALALVPAPLGRDGAMDPESAFIAALSACHMLWFLDLAASAGLVVAAYRDEAEGTLARIAPGRQAMTRVVLRPRIEFSGERRPAPGEVEALHEKAHALCFIANSVRTEVVVENVAPP
ncbi:MAG TPA: OsmC family protein [Caulobacteraceae bacterium]|nr:OsmC family protein [Caulobacteraceae bacterium]